MPKAFPVEFRRDVVAVARRGEAPMRQIAKDFGSPSRVCTAGCSRPTSRMGAGSGGRRHAVLHCAGQLGEPEPGGDADVPGGVVLTRYETRR
jgi:hypothetical protein